MNTKPEPSDSHTDSSPYIRTFAKDFAVLAEKDPEGAARSKEKRPRTKPAPPASKELSSSAKPIKGRIDDQPIKEFDPGDLSKINVDTGEISNEHPQDIPNEAYEKDTPAEILELPKIKDGDIIKSVGEISAAQEKSPHGATPGEPTDAERAEILARLKARASSLTSTPLAAPAPTPIQQSAETKKNISPVESSTIPITNTVETRTLPDLAAQKPVPDAGSPIHTYTSDFADQIDSRSANTFSVLAAEKDAPIRKSAPRNKKKSPILPIVLAIMLLLAGAGGIFFAFTFMQKTAPIAIISAPVTPIPFDSKISLDTSSGSLLSSLSEVAARPLPLNSVLYIYTNQVSTTTQGTEDNTVAQLNLPAPAIFLRNIDPSSMVGAVNTNGQTHAFFIFKVTSYERTFAGMLEWEPTLQKSLSILYPTYPNSQKQSTQQVLTSSTTTLSASTTTGTGTQQKTVSTTTSTSLFVPTINPSSLQPQFVDEVVSNRSVRALKDISGRTIVLYGYADKATLILARDEDAFTFILSRLSVSAS